MTRGRFVRAMAVGVGVMALALGGLSMAATGTASAEEPEARPRLERLRQLRAHVQQVAIAIGGVAESGGDTATIDLRAAKGAERAGGTLRFWDEEHGYYNGVVRTLTIEGGVIHATGAGPLWTPEGERVPVRFDLTIDEASKQVTIVIEGREDAGYGYTLAGTLEGFIFAGDPPREDAS
jgi:hypothetical protein